MIDLRLQDSDVSYIVGELVGRDTERCAILFALNVAPKEPRSRFVVTRVELPSDNDYSERSAASAELSPEYVAQLGKRAAREHLSLVFVHSHPGTAAPAFSRTDDRGEARLATFLAARTPNVMHATAVISAGGWCARRLGTSTLIKVVSVGPQTQVLFDPDDAAGSASLKFDRQVRALGRAGQKHLESLMVGIVGLGGTGSVAAEELVHLGVHQFILVDPDRIETTNLNRVVGSSASDVGRLKVAAAAAIIRRVAPDAVVEEVEGDVTRTPIAQRLRSVDFLLSCTDSHGSRAVIQQLAYQYLIPCIDMGSIITARDQRITGIHGRVQALAPGLPCFTCCGLLDSDQVRRDMMNDEERRRDPYIEGAHEPAPAVISINGTITSLAITMFLAMTVGVPSFGRHVLYDARMPSLRSVSVTRNPSCYICSSQGVLAKGDAQPLFTRDD